MRGSVGTATTLHRMKKAKSIPCDCNFCRNCNKRCGALYCTYYDIVNPSKKKCARYFGKPIKGK